LFERIGLKYNQSETIDFFLPIVKFISTLQNDKKDIIYALHLRRNYEKINN